MTDRQKRYRAKRVAEGGRDMRVLLTPAATRALEARPAGMSATAWVCASVIAEGERQSLRMDLLMTGRSFEMDGKRIEPADVFIKDDPDAQ